MFPIVEKIGERLVKFVDAELESGKNHFDAKRVNIRTMTSVDATILTCLIAAC